MRILMPGAVLIAWLLSGAAPAAPAPAPAGAKAGTCELEGAFLGHNYELRIHGTVGLPEGTILKAVCRRQERGKPAGNEIQLVLAVKDGAFEGTWNFPRAGFRPGPHTVEVTVREEQTPEVAAALTPKQKTLRLTAALEAGTERPTILIALEACRAAVMALRALPANAHELSQHAAAAAEGKLDGKAWSAWKGKVDPPLTLAEKTLSRRDITYHLPSAAALWSVLTRARSAIRACEAGTDGTASVDARQASFPGEADVTAALLPLRLDAVAVWAAEVDDVLRHYAVQDISNVRTVVPPPPDRLIQIRKQTDLYAATWPQVNGLAWKGDLPGDVESLMDELCRDIKILPSSKSKGGEAAPAAAPAPAAKDRKDAAGAGIPPLEDLVTRMQNNLVKVRGLVEQARIKK